MLEHPQVKSGSREGSKYPHDTLSIGSKIYFHVQCIGKRAETISSEFQYASDKDYGQMGHRYS